MKGGLIARLSRIFTSKFPQIVMTRGKAVSRMGRT
jgi:hypothetical protein